MPVSGETPVPNGPRNRGQSLSALRTAACSAVVVGGGGGDVDVITGAGGCPQPTTSRETATVQVRDRSHMVLLYSTDPSIPRADGSCATGVSPVLSGQTR